MIRARAISADMFSLWIFHLCLSSAQTRRTAGRVAEPVFLSSGVSSRTRRATNVRAVNSLRPTCVSRPLSPWTAAASSVRAHHGELPAVFLFLPIQPVVSGI